MSFSGRQKGLDRTSFSRMIKVKMAEVEVLTYEATLEALRLWHGGDPGRWPFEHLRLWSLAAHQRHQHASLADTGPAAQNRTVISWGLEKVRESAPETESLLRERFEHRRDVMTLANRFNVVEQTMLYRQRQAVHQLQEALNRLEVEAGAEWQRKMLTRLEQPTYSKLVGVDEARRKLREALIESESNFIAAATGLGGIGKTALVDQVVRDLIQTTRFEEVGWVTAKQTHLSSFGRLQVESGRAALTFPMLVDTLAGQLGVVKEAESSHLQRQRLVQQHLREYACLIVIDNLETTADYRALLPELRRWQQPTKFLLTSRVRLIDQPDVFVLSLEELPATAAFKLIRQEAKRAGFAELGQAADSDLQPIYDAVGGNPLALKLIVGQLRIYSLPQVLDRFARGAAETQEGLFDYIYSEIWESLNDGGKHTLLALSQAGESGFTFDHLLAVSGVARSSLSRALEELILFSLVDVGGNLLERRYRLHRLTELFLLQTFS
jgi:hypothetical protein